jgi:hypothetical protein
MGLALQIFGFVAAISLQLLILNAMRKGAWRKYPFVFMYVAFDLITNVQDIQPTLTYKTLSAAARKEWIRVYWWDERIIQALLFMLVISLIYRASTPSGPRRTLLLLLIGGSLLVALVSALIYFDPHVTTGKWMTLWTRNMNFCAAILDLALWATLIRKREKDQRTLMIAGALGLQFTAGAIGQALRDVSHSLVDLSSVIIVSANLICLYIWWQAFRRPYRPTQLRAA